VALLFCITCTVILAAADDCSKVLPAKITSVLHARKHNVVLIYYQSISVQPIGLVRYWRFGLHGFFLPGGGRRTLKYGISHTGDLATQIQATIHRLIYWMASLIEC